MAFNGREKVNELRQSLDPEVELLCMLSPLQVIYALEHKGKNMPLNEFKLSKFNKRLGIHDVIQNDMGLRRLCRKTT
jgi:hypothetical protein